MINVDKLIVNPEYESLLPPVVGDDFEKLETSVLTEHILHPFVINQDNVVLDGHTRLRICKLHSITQVPYIVRSFTTEIEEKEFVLSFNLNRRQLSTRQKVEIGLRILKIEMAKAKQRQICAGSTFGKGHPQKKHPQDMGDATRKDKEAVIIAAKKVNLSSETLRKAHKIQKLSEVDDKAKRLWNDISLGRSDVHSAYTSLQGQKRRDDVLQNNDDEYSVININPPRYDCKELKALKLPLKKDAVVWLWSSNQFLPSAFALLEFWGLRYQTMLTWVKRKRQKSGTQWLIDQTEHCLLATAGSPARNLTDQSSVLITASSFGRHRKPREFYERIDSLCEGDRIDIFPPKKRGGEENELR